MSDHNVVHTADPEWAASPSISNIQSFATPNQILRYSFVAILTATVLPPGMKQIPERWETITEQLISTAPRMVTASCLNTWLWR